MIKRRWILLAVGVLIIVGTIIYGVVESSPKNMGTSQKVPTVIDTPVAPTATPTVVIVQVTPTAIPTVVITSSNPVCNANTSNTPCVMFATVQDAAAGESMVNAVVHTSISKSGIITVNDDVTNVSGIDFNAIQLSCFNVQQGIWWGLKSTINNDASQTFIKSQFSAVNITYIKAGA